MKCRELNPRAFAFGNYGAGIPTDVYCSGYKEFAKWLEAQIITGYNTHPEYRTIDGHVAVMFDIDGNEYWSHIPNHTFKRVLNPEFEWGGEEVEI